LKELDFVLTSFTMAKKAKRRRGRPRTGKGLLIGVRLQPQQVAVLDDWRNRQMRPTTRPAAIRKLIAMQLFGNS
jgi:hypothetical protein